MNTRQTQHQALRTVACATLLLGCLADAGMPWGQKVSATQVVGYPTYAREAREAEWRFLAAALAALDADATFIDCTIARLASAPIVAAEVTPHESAAGLYFPRLNVIIFVHRPDLTIPLELGAMVWAHELLHLVQVCDPSVRNLGHPESYFGAKGLLDSLLPVARQLYLTSPETLELHAYWTLATHPPAPIPPHKDGNHE